MGLWDFGLPVEFTDKYQTLHYRYKELLNEYKELQARYEALKK